MHKNKNERVQSKKFEKFQTTSASKGLKAWKSKSFKSSEGLKRLKCSKKKKVYEKGDISLKS